MHLKQTLLRLLPAFTPLWPLPNFTTEGTMTQHSGLMVVYGGNQVTRQVSLLGTSQPIHTSVMSILSYQLLTVSCILDSQLPAAHEALLCIWQVQQWWQCTVQHIAYLCRHIHGYALLSLHARLFLIPCTFNWKKGMPLGLHSYLHFSTQVQVFLHACQLLAKFEKAVKLQNVSMGIRNKSYETLTNCHCNMYRLPVYAYILVMPICFT